MAATYAKLKDGSWGIRSTSSVAPGDRITVAKKSGDAKIETVRRVIWQGSGVWLASVERQDGGDSHGNSIRSGASYRAGVTAPHGRKCPHCGSRECARAWNPHDLCDED